MDSTPLISSNLVFSIPSCQDKEHQEECGFESDTDADANYSSTSDDDNESMADSDSFFNIEEALNQEEDEQEGYSYTTGDGRAMKNIEEDDTATYRGAKKEKETAEVKNGVKDEDEEISERVRKREEDKAFWEACLASGY